MQPIPLGFPHHNQLHVPLFSLTPTLWRSLTISKLNEIKLIVQDFKGKCPTRLHSSRAFVIFRGSMN